MAVAVQTMVEADAAGVAFSVDPVAGQSHTLVVDANYGPGESVVGGEAEVDHWEVHKATGKIVSQRLAEKSRKVVSLADGGTEVVRLAQTYTSLDDLEHYQTTRLTLALRRALRELGGRLHDLGVAAEPMDVFFARLQTLDSAICNPTAAQWSVLAAEIGENKLRHERARNRTPPWSLHEDEAFDPAGAGGWQGIPGSPGKVSGPVYLVHGTDDFGRIPKDAVLVARTTNPAWTPLFYGACAVVTESGGPLSHGAVTARELRKPAVMGVRAIMQSVENGQQVEVDGSRGTVRLVSCK